MAKASTGGGEKIPWAFLEVGHLLNGRKPNTSFRRFQTLHSSFALRLFRKPSAKASEALAFQEELSQRDFPTAVVPDTELPLLQDSFQIQDIELREENLVLTDSMGHQRIRPVAELVFLAAGVVSRLHFKSEWNQHLDAGIDSNGAARLVTEHEVYEESEVEFRLDFFFDTSPERQHASSCRDSKICYKDRPLRFRDRDGLRELTSAMAQLLPPERLSSFFHHPDSHPHYPTLRDYQNEIRWYFHGLELPPVV